MKAIILGVNADRGLGGQLAKRFAREGLEVLVAGRTLSSLNKIVDSIKQSGGKAVAVTADATKEKDVQSLFATAGEDLDLAICGHPWHRLCAGCRRFCSIVPHPSGWGC